MMLVEYCHFRSDKSYSKRENHLSFALKQVGAFELRLYNEDWRTFSTRVEKEPDVPRIFLWHYTPICENKGWPKQKLDDLKLRSNAYIICVSGTSMTGTEKNLQASITYARKLGLAGFSWMAIGLDELDASERLIVVFSRISELIDYPAKLPDFEQFEAAVNPPQPSFIYACIAEIARVAAFDMNRHRQFAAKLLDRLHPDKTTVSGLTKEECEALADLIVQLAEFERCRSILAHMTLNDFRQSLRLVLQTKTNPLEFPIQNDCDCVRRLTAFLRQEGFEPCMYNDSKTMFEKAQSISQSMAIQGVVFKLQRTPLEAAGASKLFFKSESLERANASWEALQVVLGAFPEYDGKNDEDWLTEIQTNTLELARDLAEKYQEAIARKNFYEW
jgi:hypothetical protein